jgi:hypothetical protein
LVLAWFGSGCDWSYVSRSAASLKPHKDERVGLCYMFTSQGGGRRVGLSAVDCALVEHSLAQNASYAKRVVGTLNYGWMRGERSTVCFAYKEDANENLRSNLALVPCEPLRQADQAGKIVFRRFFP